jgi:hypothetical protein
MQKNYTKIGIELLSKIANSDLLKPWQLSHAYEYNNVSIYCFITSLLKQSFIY